MSLLDFLTAGSADAVLAAGAVAATGAAAGAGVAGLAGATAVCAIDRAEEAITTAAISGCLNMFSSFKGGEIAILFQR